MFAKLRLVGWNGTLKPLMFLVVMFLAAVIGHLKSRGVWKKLSLGEADGSCVKIMPHSWIGQGDIYVRTGASTLDRGGDTTEAMLLRLPVVIVHVTLRNQPRSTKMSFLV